MAAEARPWQAVLADVFHYYSAAVLLLLALVVLGAVPYFAPRVAWFGLVWVALAVATHVRHVQVEPRPVLPVLGPHGIAATIGAAFTFALIVRILPLRFTKIPVGYDFGFYQAAMRAYEDAAPHLPERDLAPWIRVQFEPGLFVLHDVLHALGGLLAFDHLYSLFPLLSAGLVVPVYACTRSYFGVRAGIVAALFYAVSFTEFTVHEYLYEKNVLGLALLLALLMTLRRRSWIASGVLLGALGIMHRPTFLLAAITLAGVGAYDVIRTRRWKGWATTAAIAIPMFLPLWLARARDFFGLGFQVVQVAGDNVGAAVPEGGGTFLSFLDYQNAAVTYLPLAMAGALLALRRGRGVLPSLAFTLAFLNVALQLVFFNRFIIMLDLVALILVGFAFAVTTAEVPRWVGPTALAALLIMAAVPTISHAAQPPGPPFLWVNDDQRKGIAWLRDHTDRNATVIASNLDAPYVIAESERRTYGPGLFDDPHDAADWRAFFQTHDDATIDRFLTVYGSDLYVYHASGHGPGLGTSKFVPPRFEKVYDAAGATVWHYEGIQPIAA